MNYYKVLGDQTFTEDNILIYSLFLSYSPNHVTTAQISEYFNMYGKVLSVKCIGKCKKVSNCIINFADSKDAARVVKNRHYVIRKSVVRVRPNYSYYQPDGQKILAQLRNNLNNDVVNNDTASFSSCNNSITTEQNALILTLNDDCLEHICKHLNPEDQLNFALTCQRFCNVFKMISSVQYSNLSTKFFTDMTLWQCRIFLEIVGPQVKILILDFLFNYERKRKKIYMELFASLCRNVEKLVELSSTLDTNSLKKLLETMKKLKELELININDYLINNLQHLKNLKCLSIANNSDITGENIHLLQDLEKLCLIKCYDITLGHFRKICENLKNLQHLDIRDCGFKSAVFRYILENLRELKTIKFTPNGKNFNCLAELPKLKHLEIHNCENYLVMEGFLKNLVKYQAEKLETFKLYESPSRKFHLPSLLSKFDDDALQTISQLTELEDVSFVSCKNITDKGVLKLLQHCLKLKHLDLSYCVGITPDFINGAIKLLKEQRDHWLRTNKIKIVLSKTASIKSRLNEIPLKDYSDVLQINLCDDVDESDVHHHDYVYRFEFDSYSDMSSNYYDSDSDCDNYIFDVFDCDSLLFNLLTSDFV